MENRTVLIAIFSFVFFSKTVLADSFNGFGTRIDNYIKESAKHSQVSEKMLRGLIKMENGWTGKASPTGALGVGQFTVGTWNWLAATSQGKAIGMIKITERNRGGFYDPRRNDRINTLATGLLARWHIEQFPIYGIKNTHSNLYMAHNIGLGGYYRALNGRATIQDIKNMRRNGMKSGMSVHQFLNYQRGRYQLNWQIANNQKFSKENDYLVASNKPAKVAKTAVVSKSKFINVDQLSQDVAVSWVEPTPVSKVIWVNPL